MAVDFSKAVKTDQGLRINGFIMNQIVEKCEGCGRIQSLTAIILHVSPARRQMETGQLYFSTHTKCGGGQSQGQPHQGFQTRLQGKK